MEILIWAAAFLVLLQFFLNLFAVALLVGIAGSLAKLIRYFSGEELIDRDRWSRIVRSRRLLSMQEGNQMTYADMVGMQNKGRAWDGMPPMDDAS